MTGGRAPVALEMARLLAAAGCEVHVAESLRYYLCRVSNAVASRTAVPAPAIDPEGFLAGLEQVVRREAIDWIVPTCEELFYVSAGKERLERLCRVFAAPIGQLRRLHSKWSFIRRTEELGFAVPATRLLADPSEWRDMMELSVDAPPADKREREWPDGCVLKPAFSRSGTHVRFVKPRTDGDAGRPAERARCGSRLPAESGYPWVAQQYIRGRGLCTYSIVHEGRLTAHAAYAVTYAVPGGACYYFEPLRHPALMEWVSAFARLERFTGQLAFDFIETDDGRLYPIECNPRATSGLHLFGNGERIADALFDPDSLGGTIVEPQPSASTMLALPMLALGWRSGTAAGGWRTWLGKLASARDAVYRRDDPRPFFEQPLMLNELRRIARARGRSIMEAMTADIEWNGEGEWP
ncbi:ATP-grasp domain-containing protein [Paenibacillus flagellatus]|uniref:ATP-grasp domain-containing protein n=1 Tax=Paenibacillus flagellatus TaxID=2211139 RepID=UPI0011B40A22|nr:ATP-grasp domain-containing protein [Paenibacillus flagellatus]